MGNELIGIEIKDADVIRSLRQLPDDLQDSATDDVMEYMLNVERAYPPQKHIPYKQAYGGWFSERQRRYVMAAINDGTITVPYPRTQGFSRGWKIIGSGRTSILVNESDAGPYLKDDQRQARMPKLGGWKTLAQDLKERAGKITDIVNAAVKKAIKKRGLD